MERQRYEMAEDQYVALLQACQPVPYLIAGGRAPPSRQEVANRAWQRLGDEMGFDAMTVEPVRGASDRVFTAVPKEQQPCPTT